VYVVQRNPFYRDVIQPAIRESSSIVGKCLFLFRVKTASVCQLSSIIHPDVLGSCVNQRAEFYQINAFPQCFFHTMPMADRRRGLISWMLERRWCINRLFFRGLPWICDVVVAASSSNGLPDGYLALAANIDGGCGGDRPARCCRHRACRELKGPSGQASRDITRYAQVPVKPENCQMLPAAPQQRRLPEGGTSLPDRIRPWVLSSGTFLACASAAAVDFLRKILR
jgi:hypothetical protein